jgi:hypothetical protein
MVVDMVNDEGKQVSLYSIQPSRYQFEFNTVAAANGGVFGQLSLVEPGRPAGSFSAWIVFQTHCGNRKTNTR